MRSNPGSTVIVKVDPPTYVFQRMYICLGALKRDLWQGVDRSLAWTVVFSRVLPLEN